MNKKIVITETRCVDTLLEIAGRKFLGVPTERCILSAGTSVEIIDGPVEVKDSEGNLSMVIKVRHLNEAGKVNEGWSYLKDFS